MLQWFTWGIIEPQTSSRPWRYLAPLPQPSKRGGPENSHSKKLAMTSQTGIIAIVSSDNLFENPCWNRSHNQASLIQFHRSIWQLLYQKPPRSVCTPYWNYYRFPWRAPHVGSEILPCVAPQQVLWDHQTHEDFHRGYFWIHVYLCGPSSHLQSIYSFLCTSLGVRFPWKNSFHRLSGYGG